jgi:hypothetical protein
MKQNRFIISILTVVIAFASCDDFLQTTSNSSFTEATSFANLDFAQKQVFGIYAGFTGSYSYANLLLYAKSGSDIEMVAGASDDGKRDMARYSGTDSNDDIGRIWNQFYQNIERANICIDNLPVSPIWTNEYSNEAKALYGEAVALRALCYYELVSLFGDVPFLIKSAQAGDNFYVEKTDRDEIYEYLIQNLKEVEDYVPWMSSTAERVNKAFVKGLRARMALAYAGYSLRNKTFETRQGRHWQEYYPIALQECVEIREAQKHHLNPSFENVFRTIHAYQQDVANKEVLFEIAFGRGISGRISQVIGMRFPTSPADQKYGRAAAEISSNFAYFYSFTPGDTRRNVSVELYDYNTTNAEGQQRLTGVNQLKPCKWRRNWITPSMGGNMATVQFTGVNWPIMRYSDVLLMLAEAENKVNGPSELAKSALREVRERAFPSDMWDKQVSHYTDSVASNQVNFFQAVVNERAWEFGGEMIRKYDLVRWNLLADKIEALKTMAMAIINDEAAYKWVPKAIYWRTKADGETIDLLNQDYDMPGVTMVEGYNRQLWLSGNPSNKGSVESFLNLVWGGYNPAKNNHLLPLTSSIISSSKGVLSNDQIP